MAARRSTDDRGKGRERPRSVDASGLGLGPRGNGTRLSRDGACAQPSNSTRLDERMQRRLEGRCLPPRCSRSRPSPSSCRRPTSRGTRPRPFSTWLIWIRLLRRVKAAVLTRRPLSTEGVRDAAVLALLTALGGGAASAAIERRAPSGDPLSAWDGVGQTGRDHSSTRPARTTGAAREPPRSVARALSGRAGHPEPPAAVRGPENRHPPPPGSQLRRAAGRASPTGPAATVSVMGPDVVAPTVNGEPYEVAKVRRSPRTMRHTCCRGKCSGSSPPRR